MAICQRCLRFNGVRSEIVQDDRGNWACSDCGLIDENVTYQHQYVSVSNIVGSIMDEDSRLQIREYPDKLEKKFKEEVEALFDLYLGISSPYSSLLGHSAPTLKYGAKQWFERIREIEKLQRNRINKLSRSESRKTRYLVAIAIKFAVQESHLILLQNQLQAAGINKLDRKLPLYTKGDDSVRNPTLNEIFHRGNTFAQDSFGHLDSDQYLKKMFRRYSKWANFSLTILESMLLWVMQITKRLRFLTEMPHEERLLHLKSKPKLSKGEREWFPSDFDQFLELDWDDILPHAFHLYQFQECCRLWGNRCSPSVAIALTQWAIHSSSGMIINQYSALQSELASEYGRAQWVAAERFREMRNMLIGWSTSISLDAKIPFPQMPLPSKGGFGSGTAGYKGDNRRPIPEVELAVTSSTVIVKHWKRILKVRLKKRFNVMNYEDELWLSRKLFVVSGGLYHYQQHPHAQITRQQLSKKPEVYATPSGKKPRVSYKFKTQALAAEQAIKDFEPLQRARMIQPSLPSWTPNGIVTGYPTSYPITTINGETHPKEQPPFDFVPPPEEKSLQTMIDEPDPSSEEYDQNESDDGENTTTPTYHGKHISNLAQINATAESNGKQPFAFTIGPAGFNIDTTTTTDNAHPQVYSMYDASSDFSHSSALMSRQSSQESRTGMGSASEAEGVIRNPNARSPVAVQLHTPSSSTIPSSSPSPGNRFRKASTPLRVVPSSSSNTGTSQSISSVTTFCSTEEGMEDSHVGLLIRERSEYVQFRATNYEQSGEMMPPFIENYIWKWIRKQVNNGSMPKKITPEYLKSIGIMDCDDPFKLDLGNWVESKREIWSALESLLRLGIKPQELPIQFIPHSLISTKLLLNHYNNANLSLYPENQLINDDQIDEELEFLCSKEIDELPESYFTTKDQVKLRKARYDKKDGIWDLTSLENEQSNLNNSKKRKKDQRQQIQSQVPLYRDIDLSDIDYDDDEEIEAEDGEGYQFGESYHNEEEEENIDMSSNSCYNPTPSSTPSLTPFSAPQNAEEGSRKQIRNDVFHIRNNLIFTPGRKTEFAGIASLLKKKQQTTQPDIQGEAMDEDQDYDDDEYQDTMEDVAIHNLVHNDWGGIVGLNWNAMGFNEEIYGTAAGGDDEEEDGDMNNNGNNEELNDVMLGIDGIVTKGKRKRVSGTTNINRNVVEKPKLKSRKKVRIEDDVSTTTTFTHDTANVTASQRGENNRSTKKRNTPMDTLDEVDEENVNPPTKKKLRNNTRTKNNANIINNEVSQ
ncbi:uncharacterized protein L201_003063 [Kwoniella dendrophila CBS 6074]|uniref:TFIIB-type domain-containing protein n=1 Tax=Kwoniella dendrophila CBS 6074 TaxID=1295534 RepID=A0AAX4JTE6_9TREE